METIGVLSVLEGAPYFEVKKLWKLMQRRYHSKGVQSFSHPNLTFQGGKTDRLPELKCEFRQLTSGVKPFKIDVSSLGDFNKKAIYLRVKKAPDLVKVNGLVNQFLGQYCEGLFKTYYPENWVPHITLAMEDLAERDFEAVIDELSNRRIEFSQTIHNICLVKKCADGKIRIARKIELTQVPC